MPTLNDAPEPTRPPTRMEKEIAEILERADQQPISLSEHVRRRAQPIPANASRVADWDRLWRRLGPLAFLIGALAFAILGALVNDWSPLLAALFGVISIVSFAMIWIRRAPTGVGNSKMWRGRDLTAGPETPQWLTDLRDRFEGPSDRR